MVAIRDKMKIRTNPTSFVAALLLILFAGCNHSKEEQRLIGLWEGFIPLPATEEEVPISYAFSEDGLTIRVGQPGSETVRHWDEWEIAGDQEGDLVLHVHDDGRIFATLVHWLSDDHMRLWDQGLDESTAAEVWRQEPPPEPAESDSTAE